MNTTDNRTLIDCYHTIFDVKDAYYGNETIRMRAYEASRNLALLMEALDIDVPVRYDGQGRPS